MDNSYPLTYMKHYISDKTTLIYMDKDFETGHLGWQIPPLICVINTIVIKE